MKSPLELLTSCPIELKIYKIKSSLIILITEYKRDHRLTQKQMAKLCDVTQPRISSIVNAKFDLLSVDGLIKIALKLGIHINVSASNESINIES